jgi:hypothetical protein
MAKVTSPDDLSSRLEGAAAAWSLRAEKATEAAAQLRSETIKNASGMVFENETRRREVLSMHYGAAESKAGALDATARRYEARAKTARERGLYLDDGDPAHNAEFADLHASAIAADRCLIDPQPGQPVIGLIADVPESWWNAVENMFVARAGVPRSQIGDVVRRPIGSGPGTA